MSDAIANVEGTSEVAVPTSKFGMDVFQKMANPNAFLAYVRLYDPAGLDAKRGLVVGGEFGLVKNRKIIPLHTQFNAHLLAWRPKVFHIPGGKDKPVSYYNPESPEFQKGLELCVDRNSGWMAGPEFLLYIPEHKYCAFFMANTTMKNEASNVVDLIGKAVTFTSKRIEANGYIWFGPETTICSMPMPTLDFNEKNTMITSFTNPKSKVEDEAPEAAPANAQRADR